MTTVELTDAGNAATLGLFFSSLQLLIMYSIRAPWWETLVGRAMIALDVAIMLVLLPSVLRLLFHVHITSSTYGWYAVGSAYVAALSVQWRCWVIWHVNNPKRQASAKKEMNQSHDYVREE